MIALQEEVQTADVAFFAPVTIAYLAICGSWWLLHRARPRLWPRAAIPTADRAGVELAFAAVAVVGVLGIGQLYNADLLVPRPPGSSPLVYTLNMVIVWAPLGLVLALRRAPMATILCSPERWLLKVALGAVAGVVGIVVFITLRGEWQRLPDVLAGTVGTHELSHFFPVFMEGVGVAFLFVRLRWVAGPVVALLIPCLLFAAAHIPRQLAAGRSAPEMLAFFALNTLLPLAVFGTVIRSRDVIWIGVAHYLMDVAVSAFD